MHHSGELFKPAPIDISEVKRVVSLQLSNDIFFAKKASKFIKLLNLLPEAIDNAFVSSDFTSEYEEIKKSQLSKTDVKKELFEMKTREILDATIAPDISEDISNILKLWLLRQYTTSLVTNDNSYTNYKETLSNFKNECLVSKNSIKQYRA